MSMSHEQFAQLSPEAQDEARKAGAVIRSAMIQGWFLQLSGRSQLPAQGVTRQVLPQARKHRGRPRQVIWSDGDGFAIIVSENSTLPQATGLARG